MDRREELEALFARYNVTDFKWIKPAEDIAVGYWVRMKCTYGCASYGRIAACPPNTPPVDECRSFFDEYQQCAIFHIAHRVDTPEDRAAWSRQVNRELLKLEREVFLAGYPKAFLLVMDRCRLCADCPSKRTECVNPELARPSPEGMAVDVFSTARRAGFPIKVLTDYTDEMNRYAFLLVE